MTVSWSATWKTACITYGIEMAQGRQDHDELVPELISDTLKEDFELKLYTDVNL